MDKPKQLTLFDCSKQAKKQCRISCVSDSEERDNVIVCEAEDERIFSCEDLANHIGSNTTNCTKDSQIFPSTSQTADKGDGNLEQFPESYIHIINYKFQGISVIK